MTARARKVYEFKTVAQQGESVNQTIPIPFNSTLIKVVFSPGPYTVPKTQALVVQREDSFGNQDEFVKFDPYNTGGSRFRFSPHGELEKGDDLIVQFSNDEDRDATIELTLKEVDE
jgi:hypothetical protein